MHAALGRKNIFGNLGHVCPFGRDPYAKNKNNHVLAVSGQKPEPGSDPCGDFKRDSDDDVEYIRPTDQLFPSRDFQISSETQEKSTTLLSSSGLTRGSRLDPRLRGDDKNLIFIDFCKVGAEIWESQ